MRLLPKRSLALTLSLAIVGSSILVLAPQITPPAQAASPGYNGKIAFTSNLDGNNEIYVMNADGTGAVNLSNNPATEYKPVWSPDGTRITFHSNRTGVYQIYVMNANGTDVTNLTNNGSNNGNATWSPDGTKIAFQSLLAGNQEIYVMNADGSNQTNLTNDAAADLHPGWSPDGSKIVFYSNRTGNNEIYAMNIDGTEVVNLSNNVGNDSNPSWSPDGSKIVFRTSRDGNNEIYSMNADGSNQTNLTNDAGIDNDPSWSPDGTRILFNSNRSGDYELYAMNVDGSNLTRLTTSIGNDSEPVWQPIPNTPPVIAAKSLSVLYQTAGAVDVLTGSTDEEALSGSNLTIKTNPTHGTASVVDGKVKYSPAKDYVGTDQLTYQICDSFTLDQKCSTAVLGITVSAGPTPSVPTITSVGTVPMNGATTVYYTGHRPTFSGTAVAGSTVKVEIHSDPIILTTTADDAGKWSVTPTEDIPNGEHQVIITASKDGSTSQVLAFTLVIDPNYLIPNTGADATVLRLLGVALIAGGVGTGLLRRRRVLGPRVPSLFP